MADRQGGSNGGSAWGSGSGPAPTPSRVRSARLSALRRHRRSGGLHGPGPAVTRTARPTRRGPVPRAAGRCPAASCCPDESAGTAARRELAEETGLSADTVDHLHLEQLRTYSEPDRDPRMRVVSVAYTALLPDLPEPRGGGDAVAARWTPYEVRRPLAFDHDRILADAYERVGAKLEYTCLATSFCPDRTSRSASSSRCTRPSGASSSTVPTSGARSSPLRASSKPSTVRRDAPAAGGSPPRSTGRVPQPSCTLP